MTIDSKTLADALLAAPGWARVGLTAPTDTLRQSAANTLAAYVCKQLENPISPPDRAQLRLPL